MIPRSEQGNEAQMAQGSPESWPTEYHCIRDSQPLRNMYQKNISVTLSLMASFRS